MGIIGFLKRSKEKSNKMKNLIDAMENQPIIGWMEYEEKRQALFNDFYSYIYNDEILGPIIKSHRVSKEAIEEYMSRLQMMGYGWDKSAYIPVSAFAFPNTLEYVLKAIENDTNIHEVGGTLQKMLSL